MHTVFPEAKSGRKKCLTWRLGFLKFAHPGGSKMAKIETFFLPLLAFGSSVNDKIMLFIRYKIHCSCLAKGVDKLSKDPLYLGCLANSETVERMALTSLNWTSCQ